MQSYVSFCVLTRLFLCLEKKTLTCGLIFYVLSSVPSRMGIITTLTLKSHVPSPQQQLQYAQCYAQSIYHGWTAVGVTVKEETEGVML